MKLRLFILSGLCAWIGVSCGGKKENTGQESIRTGGKSRITGSYAKNVYRSGTG